MDARLSAEQHALRDSVVKVVDRWGPKAVADLDDAERTAKLEAAVAGAGWRELRVPDESGRPLASGVECAIVAEELARGLADTAFLGPTLAADLRRLAGAVPAERAETIALAADLAAPSPAAVAIDAAAAAGVLAVVDHDVVAGPLGTTEPSVDLTRPVAPFDPSTTSSALGALPEDARARWTALGLALTSADLVGTMRGALRRTVEYACDRRQYGVPVGSFQAIQHLLADAHVLAEGSRSVAIHAAWAVDALAPQDAMAAAATAKAYCARAARSVCETAIQVHGGIGNTWECLAHVHLRRALLSTDLFGGIGPSLTCVLEHHGIGGDDGLR